MSRGASHNPKVRAFEPRRLFEPPATLPTGTSIGPGSGRRAGRSATFRLGRRWLASLGIEVVGEGLGGDRLPGRWQPHAAAAGDEPPRPRRCGAAFVPARDGRGARPEVRVLSPNGSLIDVCGGLAYRMDNFSG
jgi:hypothetical protein